MSSENSEAETLHVEVEADTEEFKQALARVRDAVEEFEAATEQLQETEINLSLGGPIGSNNDE